MDRVERHVYVGCQLYFAYKVFFCIACRFTLQSHLLSIDIIRLVLLTVLLEQCHFISVYMVINRGTHEISKFLLIDPVKSDSMGVLVNIVVWCGNGDDVILIWYPGAPIHTLPLLQIARSVLSFSEESLCQINTISLFIYVYRGTPM